MGRTAAERVLHDEVKAVQGRNLIAGDRFLDHIAEVGLDLFGGDLLLNQLIVLGILGENTDVAGIALIARTTVRDLIEIDFSHTARLLI